ncbi:MAG TPA: NAD(P)/FAD-dependent oxidoreductase [Steroidobacteraceae bacterium]|jgi:monoamine oxidase
MSTHPIVIIGAGAAGIAAGRWLQSQGRRALILEARDRVGGRAWTDTAALGVPLDMGCAWLHSADRNPWMPYAREHGFDVIERSPVWQRRIGRDEASPEYLAAWHGAFERNEQLIAAAVRDGKDVPISQLLPQDRFRPAFDAVMTWLMGTESELVSSVDYDRYQDSEVNWAVGKGLGAVIAHAAQSLDVRLNTAVLSIDSRGPEVLLGTSAGEVRAAAVIVTVPTSVMAAGSIRFLPALQADFAEAFAAIPLGAVNKVFFEMPSQALPFAGTVHFLGTDRSSRTGSYATRPAGQGVLLGFFGGSLSAELEQRGELEIFARDELSGIFGSDFLQDIGRTVSTSWSMDPWSRGSYSAALPGKALAREQLSQPLAGRIFFAGEACSTEYFGTIHGAWYSAVAAAERALATLGEQ